MRGETTRGRHPDVGDHISIHSPHARGDINHAIPTHAAIGFQSTPLMRGETSSISFFHAQVHDFNPLPSCEGRPHRTAHRFTSSHFNPLPSCEGRPADSRKAVAVQVFQSTPLIRGETFASASTRATSTLFQSTPLMRGETKI